MGSNKNWMLRYYREGDEQGILDCLTAAFGAWPSVDIAVSPIEHLRWKLNSDPLAREFHYVAESAQKIVGTTIVIVAPLKLGARIVRMATYTDFSFHPDAQGRGRMKSFWEFAEREARQVFQVAAGFSANAAIRANMVAVGRLPLANSIQLYERSASADVVRPRRIDVCGGQRFDERVDELWNAVATHYTFCVARQAGYLNWRYADSRAGCYTIRFAQQRGALFGYAVLSASRGRGLIVDLFAPPGRADVFACLVDDAIAYFRQEGLATVRCWSPRNHTLTGVLVERGFQLARTIDGLGFTANAGASLGAVYRDEEAPVYFSMGDTDVV